MNDSSAQFGSFPIIDLELVTDYGKPIGDVLRQFFRIHMDLPIRNSTKFENIQAALDAGNEAEAYAQIKSTLPSQNPENRRALALVDAALEPGTSPTNRTNSREVPLGSFPIIDLELVTDYGKPVDDILRQFFRIHIDLPIRDSAKFEKIQDALDAGNAAEAYADIKSTLPREDPNNRRARAVVYVALNL
jgi:hypothetical protein